ncbi:MAG: hypothetical protein H6Q67_1246 [Firmicutes bacterium]|nr:hypothetical protein [Bacillota bacterium]
MKKTVLTLALLLLSCISVGLAEGIPGHEWESAKWVEISPNDYVDMGNVRIKGNIMECWTARMITDSDWMVLGHEINLETGQQRYKPHGYLYNPYTHTKENEVEIGPDDVKEERNANMPLPWNNLSATVYYDEVKYILIHHPIAKKSKYAVNFK